MIASRTHSSLNKLLDQTATIEDIEYLLSVNDLDGNKLIEDTADRICREHYGDKVYLRGLIEISNYCIKDCNYCGLRKSNKEIERYRVDEETLIETIHSAYEYGFRTIVMQGGEDPGYDKVIINALKDARKNFGDELAITLSLGERDYARYKEFVDAGANRFLMRVETTDEKLFNWLHPDDNLENRINCLKQLKELGYEVGSGILFGLPNQSLKSIARDLIFLRDMGCHMVGVGPFCPNAQTPMKDCPPGTIHMSTRLVSLIRIMIPQSNIPATTAMGTIHPEGRTLALKAGANVLMPNCTPYKLRKNYQLYDNKIGIAFDDEDSPTASKIIAEAAGKEVSYAKGTSLKYGN